MEANKRMDMMEVVELVAMNFYRQFDWKNGSDDYYNIESFQMDSTFIAKEYPSCKRYSISYAMENREVLFAEKEEWVEVEKEYVPVQRDYIPAKEALGVLTSAPQKRQVATSVPAATFRSSEVKQLGDKREIGGYGVVFNSDSSPLYVQDQERGVVKVVERITRQSLDGADMDDLVGTFNHNFDYILGRTSNGTMDVSIDDKGIYYQIKPNNTTYANDLLENLRTGNVTGSSFFFSMDASAGYDFVERSDGTLEATPRKITKIYEMGPVTSPAYPATTSERRSMLHTQAAGFLKRKLQEEKPIKQEPAKPKPDPEFEAVLAARKRRAFMKNLQEA